MGAWMTDENKVDYRAVLDRAVGSAHDDRWDERTDPNTGSPLNAAMFRVSADFADDYAKEMDERYGAK